MVVYANRTEKSSRDTLIIRVGEQKGETLELLPLPSLPSVLKIQFNNMINSQKYKYDNGRKDIKDEYRKINGNWRIPDFSLFQKNEFAKISNSFNVFYTHLASLFPVDTF